MQLPPTSRPHTQTAWRRAFSLVEVLLAIFILGIGMIMVASVFPVGANWTRQTTEESVGQTIAQNALAVIEGHYGVGGNLHSDLNPGVSNTILSSPTPFQLQALPLFATIPASERAYQFGSSRPFPAANPAGCTYFWSALARLSPAHKNPSTGAVAPASSYRYDLYILVFRKGDAQHKFIEPLSAPYGAYTAIPLLRNYPGEDYIPSVAQGAFGRGTITGGTPAIINAVPPIGGYGLGLVSGTVFRQGFNSTITGAAPRPALIGQSSGIDPTEPVIFSPPADGTQASPLIYIYQTTLSQ